MRNVVLVDIDHTLSNAFWRDPMIGAVDWDEYHEASINDEPLHDMVHLINALHRGDMEIIGLTARPAKWRGLTMRWLARHSVLVDNILMRPDEAFHPSPEIKVQLVKENFKDPKNEIALLIEDRDDVCVVFRAMGITVLQCHGRRD